MQKILNNMYINNLIIFNYDGKEKIKDSASKLLEGFELPKEGNKIKEQVIYKMEVYNNNFPGSKGNISFQQGGKNNTQNNPQSQNMTQGPEKVKKKKSIFGTLFLVALVIAIFAIGIAAYTYFFQPTAENNWLIGLSVVVGIISTILTVVFKAIDLRKS